MKNDAKQRALDIAKMLVVKKAEDIKILEVKDISGLCDYFVICSASSGRQVNSLCDDLLKKFKARDDTRYHCQKDQDGRWILVDFFDVIVHIFLDEARYFYNLEYLWSEAKKVSLPKIKSGNSEK